MKRIRTWVAMTGAAVLVGCGGATQAKDPAPVPTWYADVKPLTDAYCVACHDGVNIGPMPLTSYQEVAPWADVVRQQVVDRVMPPWPADSTCREYKYDRSLTDTQVKTIADWVTGGMPMGDPSQEPQVVQRQTDGLSRVDLSLTVEGEYRPRVGEDDYRCFVLDWPETTTKYVTGFDVRPTNRRVVHHVNIYSVAAASAQPFRVRQNRNATPGYACTGGGVFSGLDTALLGSWAPGSHGLDFPTGTGIPVEPGGVVVLETHYSAPQESGPDQGTLVLSLEDNVEKRAIVGAFWDFLNWGGGAMRIPANDPDVIFTHELDPAGFVPLYAPWIQSNTLQMHMVGLHMHYLGTQGYMLVRNDAGRSECALAIPDWDFHWQSGYQLAQPVEFRLGVDRIYLECHFDNTTANQPLINGVPQAVGEVRWGEDSTDEMCIGFVFLTEG